MIRAFTRTLPLALAVAALAGCASEAKVEPPARPAIVQQARPAAQQQIETYSGAIRARYESELGFRIAGKVQERRVDVGQQVKQGQILAILEPDDAQLQVSAARAQVAWAKADLALAKAEMDRHAAMLEKKFISQALFDARKNAWEAAAARLQQTQAQLAVAENQSDYTALKADHDGVITAVRAEVGQVVAAGQAIFALAHDGDVEALIAVPESRVANFSVGQPVVVQIWARDNQQITGSVREIAPEADAAARTYDVRVKLDDPQALATLGMTARVFLDGGNAPDAVLLPMTALHQKDGKPAVWVLDAKTKQVRLVPVTVGQYREEGVTITGGLAADLWVVTNGVHKLVEGQAVRPVDTDNRPLRIAAS